MGLVSIFAAISVRFGSSHYRSVQARIHDLLKGKRVFPKLLMWIKLIFRALPEHYEDPVLTKLFAPRAIFEKKTGQKCHQKF